MERCFDGVLVGPNELDRMAFGIEGPTRKAFRSNEADHGALPAVLGVSRPHRL